MKFNQNYKVEKPKYQVKYTQKITQDKETGTPIKENTAEINVKMEIVKDLYNEIQANRDGTELRIQILKNQLDINKLEQDGLYLNNDKPIDLEQLAKTQSEYKEKLQKLQEQALKEKLENQKKETTNEANSNGGETK